MMIDQVGEKTILVTLARDDMERYSLDFAGDGEAARKGLTRLMLRVGEACGLDHSDKSYLIEALPAGDSCLLIITIRSVRHRSRYRIKRTVKRQCCAFADADALLDYLGSGSAIAGCVYDRAGEYCLLPDYPLSPRAAAALSEYGALRELSPVEVARLLEHGREVLVTGSRHIPHPRAAQP